MFKSYSLKQPTRSDSEDSSDEDSIGNVDDITMGLSNMNVNSTKVYNQKDNLIHNVQELRERVDQIRKGWFDGETKRQNKGYNPSEHDKIKFNINLYLGQCLQFFVKNSSTTKAIVLDSEDLGSSATLAAFGLQPSHIYVPNYWDGPNGAGSEYTSMKENLPELACFPISLEGFITALGESNDAATFRKQLNDKYEATKYTVKQCFMPDTGRLLLNDSKYDSKYDFTDIQDCKKYNKEAYQLIAKKKPKFLKAELQKRNPAGNYKKLKKEQLIKKLQKVIQIRFKSTYIPAPTLVEPLPEYVKHLDFAYLDYCGEFMNKESINNSETVADMFTKKMFPTESSFVLGITGCFAMFAPKTDAYIKKKLKKYRQSVLDSAGSVKDKKGNAVYNIREDQFFVYKRESQEGSVEESLAHRDVNDIPEDVNYKETKHSMMMFFMSFIGNASTQKLKEWDELFDQKCSGGNCKILLGHRQCLYQKGKDRLHLTKPFCNYRITDWYFVDPRFKDYTSTINKFANVPMDDVNGIMIAYLKAWDSASKLPDKIFKTFKGKKEIVNMTEIIEKAKKSRTEQNPITYNGRTFELDSVHEIRLDKIFKGKVSIECILGDIVGLHFTESDDINIPGIKIMKVTAFLVQIDDFYNMLDEPDSDSDSDLIPINNRHDFLASDNGLTTHKRVTKKKKKVRTAVPRKGGRVRKQAKPKTFEDIGL